MFNQSIQYWHFFSYYYFCCRVAKKLSEPLSCLYICIDELCHIDLPITHTPPISYSKSPTTHLGAFKESFALESYSSREAKKKEKKKVMYIIHGVVKLQCSH